jgi:LPXTG-site transpeptidase (sortase) family protein
MSKKLTLFGIFCLVMLFASAGALSNIGNALAFSNSGHDFSMPHQQGEPTATPTSGTSPLPTPTNTPIPAPTSLPPTGTDLLRRAELADEGATTVEQEAGGPRYLATGSLVYPVRLLASAIDLDTKVKPLGWRQVVNGEKEVSIWHMVDDAAGWHLNSAVPGQAGNAVMSGHNNIGGSIFRNLYRLQPGDTITVWTNEGKAVAYRVDEVRIVKETYANAAQQAANAQAMAETSDERLTLITCWPSYSNTHRVIVVAYPAE